MTAASVPELLYQFPQFPCAMFQSLRQDHHFLGKASHGILFFRHIDLRLLDLLPQFFPFVSMLVIAAQ